MSEDLSTLREKAAELAAFIDRFEAECADYTDTGEAWDVLNRLRSELNGMAGEQAPAPAPEPAPEPNRKPTLKGILAEFDVWTRAGLAEAITAALERYDAHLNDPHGTDDGADAQSPTGDDYNEIGDLIQGIIDRAMERA